MAAVARALNDRGSSPWSVFGFQGSYADASGLDYMINRYYTPTTDQFLSVDPDLLQTGQPYAFTTDDPLNMTDPLGLRGTYCIDNYKGHPGYTTHYFQGTNTGPANGKCIDGHTQAQVAAFAAAYNANLAGQKLEELAGAFAAFQEQNFFFSLTSPLPQVSTTGPSEPSFGDVFHSVSAAVNDVTSISTHVTVIEHWYGSESQSPPIHWLSANRGASCAIQGVDLAGATLVSGGGDAIYLFARGFLSEGTSNVIAGSGGFLAGCNLTPTPESW